MFNAHATAIRELNKLINRLSDEEGFICSECGRISKVVTAFICPHCKKTASFQATKRRNK